MVDLTKELLDSVRDIDGFPIGKDEDIIALSDPPYYTACPNPFIEDFIKEHGKPYDPETDDYHKEPFATDVSEGKNDPIYNVHSYHTKVPHQPIMRYILHYTEPGDIIFDGFSGTGMTGVAAQLCGDKSAIELLEYKVDKNGTISQKEIGEKNNFVWKQFSKLGVRRAILNDLSPSATFISSCTISTQFIKRDISKIRVLLSQIKKENEIYRITKHSGWKAKLTSYDTKINNVKDKRQGTINYIVWSDVISCPECGTEWTHWESPAVEISTKVPKQVFNCDVCNLQIKKGKFVITRKGWYDPVQDKAILIQRKKPVLINYSVGSSRYEKWPDEDDLLVIEKIDNELSDYIPFACELTDGFNTAQPKGSHGWTHTHHFFSSRTLFFLSKLLQNAKQNRTLLFVISAALQKLTLRNRFMPWYGGRALVGPHPGTLYIPNLSVENDVISQIEYHLKKIEKLVASYPEGMITTQSSTQLPQIADNAIDYIFIDPPFGSNIMYSELNSFWECMLNVRTNNLLEAIENSGQNKSIEHYTKQMKACFSEFYRILKPGRWITIEFHNSRNAIWNIIGESITSVGFVIADIRILDKKKGTIHQLSSTNSVDKDLIISAYKINQKIEERIKSKSRSETSVWDFAREHLKHLPVYVENDGVTEIINERQNHLIYDRMIAFFMQKGIPISVSASEFYYGIKTRFPERDGMYFLYDQVAEYDSKRMKSKRLEQSFLTMHDEKSAIQWLRRLLKEKPQTYQDIQPTFLQNLYKYKHENLPELREILEQNFVQDKQERWYVPDPSQDTDLEQLRNRALIKEYREYENTNGRLKVFRSEAVRVGFSDCWKRGDYGSIIKVAEKISQEIILEDPTLLMYYDNAKSRIG